MKRAIQPMGDSPTTFRGSLLWRANLFAGAFVGLTGAVIVPIAFKVFFREDSAPNAALPLFALLVASGLLVLLAYFPGNLGVFWPHAIELYGNSGIKLVAPFKKVFVPISELGEVEDSLFWQGYVVHLRKPHAALTQFLIPRYFGPQRKALVDAILAAQRHSIEGA